MMEITFKIDGQRELERALKAAGADMERAAGSALFIEGEAIMALSNEHAPADEGILRASGFVKKPKLRGRNTTVTIGYGGAAKAYALAQHEGVGPAVGRPPFRPPSDAFKGWARRKLGDESLAFVVARSVGQKGFKGKKFLESAVRERARGMGGRLAARIRRFVARGGR